MAVSLINSTCSLLSLSWLTGPIFEKELRVSSRRKRYYVLRSAYLLLLTVFVAFGWFFGVSFAGASATYRVSRMSVAATMIITTISWFQFISLQLIAVVMLSNAINGEIQKKTLDVLASTPITSLQIIMGKLAGKLLQLVLLLAVSLPLLAVIRAFGGVPWDYLIAAGCVTLTATIFAASVSLFLSTVRKNAYTVITSSIAIALVLFVGLPLLSLLLSYLTKNTFFRNNMLDAVGMINPFVVMSSLTASMYAAGVAVLSWPVHCALMLALSAILVLLSVFRVRPAILAQDKKPLAWRLGRRWKKRTQEYTTDQRQRPAEAPTCRITGDCIMWRELNRPVTGSVISDRAGALILGVLVVVVYSLGIYYQWIVERGFHSVFVGFIASIILLRTATLAAITIASEKQTKTWPILLTTPLDDAQIIRSKAFAVLRRTVPLWIILTGHIVLFTITGILHPLAGLGAFCSIVPAVLFLIGSGLLAGTFFKTNTGAIIATFAIPLVAWFFCPCFTSSNPAFVAGWSMMIDSSLFTELPDGPVFFAFLALAMLVVPTVSYVVFGLIFLWWAKCRVRRKIFT